MPLDKESYPVKCLVQVKSTDRRPGRWSVKLDNWIRFVKSPLPAFFLILEFDSKDSCQQAYLVHVDERYIRCVLKRLRELDPNNRPELHKIKLQFRYSEEDRLLSLDGKGLEQAIRTHVGNAETYAAWKIEAVRSAGYEDGNWQLDFAIPLPSEETHILEFLVDFSLGLVPHLEPIRGELKDVRFGILASEPTEVFEAGRLEIVDRKPVGNGTIVFTTSDKRRELRLDTEVYLPQGFGFQIEREHLKARFAAPFIDFVLWPFQEGKVDLKFDLPHPDERHALKRLQPVSEFVLLLHEASAQNGRIDFEVRFGSVPLGKGHINVEGPLAEQTVEYVTAISHAWIIAKHFDVHHDADLRAAELLWQKERLMLIASILKPIQPGIKITYWSEEALPNDGKKLCLPYVTGAIIGQYRVAVAIAMIGTSEPTGLIGDNGSEFEIKVDDVILCREHLYDREEEPRYSMKDLAQSVVEDYEETAQIVIIGGVNSHLFDS